MWGITVVHTTQAAHWMQRGQPRFFYECHCSNCACMVTYIPLLCPCVSMHGRSDCVHMDNSDQLAARLSLCVEHPVSHMYLENKYGTIHGVWGVVYTLGIMVQSPVLYLLLYMYVWLHNLVCLRHEVDLGINTHIMWYYAVGHHSQLHAHHRKERTFSYIHTMLWQSVVSGGDFPRHGLKLDPFPQNARQFYSGLPNLLICV